MMMPDPFEEKSKHFFPREIYFWVVNTLGWIFTLTLMDPGGEPLANPDAAQIAFRRYYLALVWLAYYTAGTFILLVFRRSYYRQRWYQKKFVGSLPLVILCAFIGGIAMAVVVVLPLQLMRDGDFRVYNQAGVAVYEGIVSVTLFNGSEHAFLILAWLLGYLGVEGPVNARNLAFKALTLETSLADARLNALAGQINPHFLFNALNNIRFMIRRNAECAEESLIDLSEILRHSLEASQQAKALLGKELVVVERYLSLMKVQMQRRLDYSINAANIPDDLLLPPMIIQMLAENAVKHGVEQIKDGGRVDINCSIEAGKLCIEVKNPVLSADVMNGNAEMSIHGTNFSGNGLGLSNIRNRLSLLYGGRAQLSMSQHDGNFVVRITLPVEEPA